MLDLIFVAATVVFVLLAVLYVQACDRLRLELCTSWRRGESCWIFSMSLL